MTTKFAFGQKKEEPEETQIKLDEQMIFNKIPPNIQTQFTAVYGKIVANRDQILKEKDQEVSKNSSELKETLYEIHKDAISYIFGDLSSLARQIDSGTKTLNEFKKDLAISKSLARQINSDFENSGMQKTHPTPFLLKYVDDIEDTAETLSQSIIAYSTHLQPQINTAASSDKQYNNNENQILYCFLKEQSDAIFRCSTKVSHLIAKMNRVRQVLSDKLKINTINFSIDDYITDNSNIQTINTKYQQFLEQKKQKEKRNVDESGIFGDSTAKVKVATNTGFFKNNFSATSNSMSKGFGQKNTTTTSTSTSNKNTSTNNVGSGFTKP